MMERIRRLRRAQLRRVTTALHKHGITTAPARKAPFRIAFPAALTSRLMPGL
jgi:hypothetical protein